MAWQYYTRPIEPDEVLTPNMVEELWLALEERIGAACDTGSFVDFSKFPDQYVTSLAVGDRRTRSDNPWPFLGKIAEVVEVIASDQFPRPGAFVYQPSEGADFQRFGLVGPTSVLRVAALDLGYTSDEAVNIRSAALSETLSYRSAHVANVVRRALQRMEYRELPLLPEVDSSGRTRLTNFLKTDDATESRSEVDSDYAEAKSKFFSASPSTFEGFSCFVSAIRLWNCNYLIDGSKFNASFKLGPSWEKGYELFFQFEERDMDSEEAELTVGVEGKNPVVVPLIDPGSHHVVSLLDQTNESSPLTSGTIDAVLDVYDVPSALDEWDAPTRDGCDSETETVNRRAEAREITIAGQPRRALFFGKIDFDYGPDPE